MLIAATEAKTVCDPFCGSGSTGVAALMEGRRFVGIEQSAEYCRMAGKRLAEARPERGINDNLAVELDQHELAVYSA